MIFRTLYYETELVGAGKVEYFLVLKSLTDSRSKEIKQTMFLTEMKFAIKNSNETNL